MIRAVLDTNIIVSALITKKPSPPSKIYKAFTTQQFMLITSPSILAEVEEVINRDNIIKHHKLSRNKRKEIIELFAKLSYVTLESISNKKVIIHKDASDDKFLLAASDANADYIVTGDYHLLELKEHEGIKIVTPKKFVTILETDGKTESKK